jgi:hypothetical protein
LVVARLWNDGQRTERVLVSYSTRPLRKPAAPVVTRLRLPAPGAGDPWYALQNLKAAVRILATHPDSLRGRLCKALFHLAPVTARDFPESLRPEFEALRRDTTKNPSRMQRVVRGARFVEERSGTIAATVPYMRTKTLIRIAERLHDLCSRLSHELVNPVDDS